MKALSLNGAWRLSYGPETGDLPRDPSGLQRARWPSIEAIVPGNVELDLQRAGIEGDPYFGDAIYGFRKYELYQWWFTRDFSWSGPRCAGEEAVLRLGGVDTYATIWLNGVEIGRTDDMLVEHDLAVTDALREGRNTIVIRIESAMRKAQKRDYPVFLYGNEGHDEISWLRKPAHCFGWDIAPRFPSAGIWRDIAIVRRPLRRMTDLYFATRSVGNAAAALQAAVRFTIGDSDPEGYSIRIEGRCRDRRFRFEKPLPFVSHSFLLPVADPLLWNPVGYGDPNVYTVVTQLCRDGQVLDSRRDSIGIRTVRVETEHPSRGKGTFRILVNDVPVMVLGTNWVPLDAFHSRDRSRLGRAFRLVEDLRCNLLRLWGGNVYESDAFYNLCDRKGVMVWQDFSFACSAYPYEPEFLDTVRKESSCVIRRLRNHPSLILWAGDNEVDQDFLNRGYVLPDARYNPISREVLPAAVRDHDPYRKYLPSSPFIPHDGPPDPYAVPEQHLWGARDYFKGDFYRSSRAEFVSEIGYHGCPARSSLASFLSKESLWPPGNGEWLTHSTEYRGLGTRGESRIELMRKQVLAMFGAVPDRAGDFIFASQASQAEALKFFVETARSNRAEKSGIVWWNLLDCWPQVSDAVVDYYFRKKIAYHCLKRIQGPVCVMMGESENWLHRITIDSLAQTDVPLSLSISDGDTDEVVFSASLVARANANTAAGSVESVPGRQRLYIMKWEMGGGSFSNHYISGFVPYDLERFQAWMKRIESLPPAFSAEECCG